MPQILPGTTSVSADVLLVEHRNSEPFDHPVNPANVDTIVFNAGEVAAVDNNGYIVRADKDNVATIKVVGLFALPSVPSDARKNNYMHASGHASVFSNGIVRLSTQISEAAVNATDILYLGDDGKLTTNNASGVAIGVAMTSRTSATDSIRFRLKM